MNFLNFLNVFLVGLTFPLFLLSSTAFAVNTTNQEVDNEPAEVIDITPLVRTILGQITNLRVNFSVSSRTEADEWEQTLVAFGAGRYFYDKQKIRIVIEWGVTKNGKTAEKNTLKVQTFVTKLDGTKLPQSIEKHLPSGVGCCLSIDGNSDGDKQTLFSQCFDSGEPSIVSVILEIDHVDKGGSERSRKLKELVDKQPSSPKNDLSGSERSI